MKYLPQAALLVSIFSVAFAAIFITTIDQQADIHPFVIAFYRLLFMVLLLVPFLLFSSSIRKELWGLSKKSIVSLAGIGVILAAHFALWVTSLTLTSVASSVILVTAHPIIVAPLSYILLKEQLRLAHIIGIVLSLFGVTIIVFGNIQPSDLGIDTWQGNLLALLGGIAAGLYILGGRKHRKNLGVITYAFIVYGVATCVLFMLCLIVGASFGPYPFSIMFLLLGMALIAGLFGHTLYNWSLRYIRASLASVALVGEPLGSAFLAFILPWIHQVPSEFTIIGGMFILVGVYLTSKTITIYKK